jgi:hypothetical protein
VRGTAMLKAQQHIYRYIEESSALQALLIFSVSNQNIFQAQLELHG